MNSEALDFRLASESTESWPARLVERGLVPDGEVAYVPIGRKSYTFEDTTMDPHLKKLIRDPRFLKYHQAETAKERTFNPFDVLRYADYEIRHSNVLAWLLQPDGTHGIGDGFLRDFTTALNEEASNQGVPPVPIPSSFDAEDVRVERELHYVDITLFLTGKKTSKSVVIAIENKMGEAVPEHVEQVLGYDKKLHEEYKTKYDVIQSVLLTTSPTPDASEHGIIHVGWARICDIVKSIREREQFEFDEGERVRAFLGHYLEIVERFVGQPETDRDYFTTLLEDHRLVLNKLLKEREDGVGGVDKDGPDELGTYRKTLDRLINDFRQKPRRLRSAIQTFLKGRGFRTWTNTPPGYQWFYLYLSDPSMEATRKSLNIPWLPRWSIILGHREVLLQLQFTPPEEGMKPAVDRIAEFMQENPIDPSPERRERYPMDIRFGGHLVVYRHRLITDDELSAIPVSEIEDVALGKMAAFLDQDFRRIETYLKCMAFDPGVSV